MALTAEDMKVFRDELRDISDEFEEKMGRGERDNVLMSVILNAAEVLAETRIPQVYNDLDKKVAAMLVLDDLTKAVVDALNKQGRIEDVYNRADNILNASCDGDCDNCNEFYADADKSDAELRLSALAEEIIDRAEEAAGLLCPSGTSSKDNFLVGVTFVQSLVDSAAKVVERW